jgi:hypothetical protein
MAGSGQSSGSSGEPLLRRWTMKLVLANIAILSALALSGAKVELAQRDQCESQCRAAHSQCRVADKSLSSPKCDAQLQACLDSCGKGR